MAGGGASRRGCFFGFRIQPRRHGGYIRRVFRTGGGEDFLGGFLGGGGRGAGRGPFPRKGRDIEYALDIDFLHAVKGTEVELTVRRDGGAEKGKVMIISGIKDGQGGR